MHAQASPANPTLRQPHRHTKRSPGVRASPGPTTSDADTRPLSDQESDPGSLSEGSEGYQPGPEPSTASDSSELIPSADLPCVNMEPDWQVYLFACCSSAVEPDQSGRTGACGMLVLVTGRCCKLAFLQLACRASLHPCHLSLHVCTSMLDPGVKACHHAPGQPCNKRLSCVLDATVAPQLSAVTGREAFQHVQGGLDDDFEDDVTSPVSPAPQISCQLQYTQKPSGQVPQEDEETTSNIELGTDSCSILLRSFNAYLESTGQQPVHALVEPGKAGKAVQRSRGPGGTSTMSKRGRQYTAQVQPLLRHGMA